MIFCLFIIALFILIFVIDAIPQLYTWQSRIKMGRYATNQDWNTNVTSISSQWLKKTPTIKVTDNKRLIIIDILKGNYKKSAIQHWQQAALLLGLNQQFLKINDTKIKAEIERFINSLFDASGNWKEIPKEIDSVILAYAVINCNWIDTTKYKLAFDACYQMIQNLKGEDGTIAYRKHAPNYRYVDTIGFICPFLINYGVQFQNNEAVELAIKQIQTYNKFGMLQGTFIPCHTYSISSNLPVGLFGWGRGLGWYAIGLIDSWNALPETHPSKNDLTHNVEAFAKMALKFQNKNGSWSWQILNKNAQFDSSTTATLAWFLSNAAKITAIQPDCEIAKEKALNYLKSVTRRNGSIDFSQGDTKSIGVYSQEFDILPFTQGFCLRTIYN